MKRMMALLGILTLLQLDALADEAQLKQALKSTDAVVWAGLDYSLMQVVGETNKIPVPDLFLMSMPEKWNDLFLDERIEGVAGFLKKRIYIDISGVTERNKTLGSSSIFNESHDSHAIDSSNVSLQEISNEVKSYKMNQKSGVALCFIIDRFVYEMVRISPTRNSPDVERLENAGAIYVVFFDISTRQVLSVKREVHYVATGGSFRFFWFGPIKDTDAGLSRYSN